MKTIDVIQGSLQWLIARAGMPTASEFKALVTPKWEIRRGKGVKTYVAIKAAERWTKRPLPGFSTFATEQGKIREDKAVPWFELEYGMTLQRPGLITDDAGLIGCSPDAMLEDGTGLEIKCPEPQTHVKYVLDRCCPDDHLAQVHGGMLVTGAARWTFMSYSPRYPALVVPVRRDEKIIAVLREALDQFLVELQAAYDELLELNGGPPPEPEPLRFSDNDDPRKHLFEGLNINEDDIPT